MHDRRIDGTARIFGNESGLYKNAMVWFDHETGSLWSQPNGTAIAGPLEGVRLQPIPASIGPWATWLKDHPTTVVLADAMYPPYSGVLDPFARVLPGIVVGVELGGLARGFYLSPAYDRVAVNDAIGEFPVLLYANPDDRTVEVYLRRIQGMDLRFAWVDGVLTDETTGSTWDGGRGLAIDGPLRGTLLRQLPYSTSWDWAWEDFHPGTTFYTGAS